MADINELPLVDEPIPTTNLDEVQVMGGGLPQPGTYLFTLPAGIDKCWEVLATNLGQRLQLYFSKDNRLSWKRGDEEGHLTVRVSGREKGKAPSDLVMLLKSQGFTGTVETNKQISDGLNTCGGKPFVAEIIFTAYNKNLSKEYRSRTYKKKDGTTQTPVPKGTDGKFLTEFQDPDDGSLVRVRAELENIRAAK